MGTRERTVSRINIVDGDKHGDAEKQKKFREVHCLLFQSADVCGFVGYDLQG